MALLFTVIFAALVFEYINGFHDTANSIATVVSTKVLLPRQAIAMAAITNLGGALVGTAVAKTIYKGLVVDSFVTPQTIVCALLGGIIWNLVTWWLGLPSSSTHALVGGLCGATFATAHGQWAALIWTKAGPAGAPWWKNEGILYKVVLPMLTSPVIGFVVGLLLMSLIFVVIRDWRPRIVQAVFGKLQIASAGYMGWMHGYSDAQKTMGIIALALAGATKSGVLDSAPDVLSFLRMEPHGGNVEIPLWIKVTCASVMAAGTAAGGWRIIQTMGHKMVKIQAVHGFAAETTAATVMFAAGSMGMPVSTTHAITTSIMGVGCAKRWNALNLPVIRRIMWAWVLTIPATALLGYAMMRITQVVGW